MTVNRQGSLSVQSCLRCLLILYPAERVLYIGAGDGQGPLIKLLQDAGIENVTLVEGDDAEYELLQRNDSVPSGWRLTRNVVAPKAGPAVFYRATNREGSGLLEPESLHGIWPNIKRRRFLDTHAVTLEQLIADNFGDYNKVHWLFVDCLPSLSIVHGAGNALEKFSVIVLRIVLDTRALSDSGSSFDAANSFLMQRGFRCLITEEATHPTLGFAVFVRDYRARGLQLDSERRQLAHEESSGDEETADHFCRSEKRSREAEDRLTATTLRIGQPECNTIEAESYIETLRQRLQDTVRVGEELREKLCEFEGFARSQEVILERLRQLESSVETSVAAIQKSKAELLREMEQKLNEQKAQAIGDSKKRLEELLTRQRQMFKRDLETATKQIEAFLTIQHYLTAGIDFSFHGWPISPDLGLFVLGKLRTSDYDLIIEFGSGTSTALMAKALQILERADDGGNRDSGARLPRIISFEHDASYYQKTHSLLKAHGLRALVDLIHAPLTNWTDGERNYSYYDCHAQLNDVGTKLGKCTQRIFVLIDGPPGDTCEMARYPAIPHLLRTLEGHDIDFVLDDARRSEEKRVIEAWKSFCAAEGIELIEDTYDTGTEKGLYFAMCRSRGATRGSSD